MRHRPPRARTTTTAQTTPLPTTTRQSPEVKEAAPEPEGPKEVLDEDAVFNQVRPKLRDAIFRLGVLDAIDAAWRKLNDDLYEQHGLRFGFAYTALGQWAPESNGGRDGVGGDLDFTGVWRALGSEDDGNAGFLGFATEWRHRLGSSRTPSELAGEFGGFSQTTQSFNTQDFSLGPALVGRRAPRQAPGPIRARPRRGSRPSCAEPSCRRSRPGP